MYERILMWRFLLAAAVGGEHMWAVAAGVYCVGGHLGRILDIFAVVPEEDDDETGA